MRKFLQVVGIAALAILVAAPAMAIDFQMRGSYRVRLYSADAYGTETATVATSPFVKSTPNARNQADIRFRPWFIARDDKGNLESGVRFEIGDINFGSAGGGGTGTDGINVETKWAYIDFQLPFGLPARLRGGLQGFYLPKGMILDDDAGGLRLYGKSGMVGYEAFWFVVNDIVNGGTQAVGGTLVGPANDDIDVYGAKVDLALGPAFNPYVYGVYRHGSVVQAVNIGTTPNTASSDGYWLGAGATGKLGMVVYDIDVVYGYDEPHLADGVGAAAKRRGWQMDGGVEFPIGPAAIGLRGTYASGDNAATATTNEDLPSLRNTPGTGSMGSYTPKGVQVFWNSNGSAYWRGGYASTAGNIWGIGGYVQYYPVKALLTRIAYFYAGASKSNTNFFTGKATYGQEINLLGEYTIWTGMKVWGFAGVFLVPSKGRAPGAEVDLKDAVVFSTGVQHDF
ncbi:MAG: hypothetical protein HY712_00720 [candidate division NC10 bacterium]|nr:hypothetical protein [candidate division NC10 bacterium]